MKETTVDFIILFKSGNYLCKKGTKQALKTNHLNAVSFDTRKQAQDMAPLSTVLKRVCNLEEI